MKKPGKMKPGGGSKERSQGKLPPSGVNKPVNKPAMETFKPGGTYTRPTQRQKV